jgi:spore coat polysaccharide biosynthesis protein SpsF
MRRVIIIQARTGSTRLPGKVLMDLGGSPMLVQQLRRLRKCRRADEIVVATTKNSADDAVVAIAETEGTRWFRGSEDDVLDRYIGAARDARAEIIVRITADCPLIDPGITDCIIEALETGSTAYDYASNVVKRTFPVGLDAEAFFKDTLDRMGRLGRSAPSREHVTFFLLRERPDLFMVRSVTDTEDNSDLRWTVDTSEDLALARVLYRELGLAERFLSYEDVLGHVRAHPEWLTLNAHIRQKQL